MVCRYADYIGSVFGTEEGKRCGYPGHEEIELALVKLQPRAKSAISNWLVLRHERGRSRTTTKRHEVRGGSRKRGPGRHRQNQSHLPV